MKQNERVITWEEKKRENERMRERERDRERRREKEETRVKRFRDPRDFSRHFQIRK
jgi:hypothetical protein